ncbi:MAG TPA: DUF3592 domain-containing protein [Candidatus Koribacter sp.]
MSASTAQTTKAPSAGVLPVIAVANLIVAIMFVLFSTPFYYKQIHILHSWPAADAQVVRAEVVPAHIEVPADGQKYFDSDVQFLFTVDGVPHFAEVFSHRSPNIEKVRYETNKFTVGSHQSVRYNPANPTDIRANAGYNRRFFFAPLLITSFGFIFFVFAAIFYWMAVRSRKAQIAGN